MLNGCELIAEYYTEIDMVADHSSSSEESDFESCTIEVIGVKKETAQNTVKMFFTSRKKSGGGNIDKIWQDSESGNYIITFSERACKLAFFKVFFLSL